jgi:hypothetical protein
MAVGLSWSSVAGDPGLRVLAVRPEPADDAFAAWVGDGLARVLGELRAVYCGGAAPPRVALLVELPPDGGPLEAAAGEALVEGVRGIAEALTRELRERARVNVVIAGPGAAVAPALDYLAGDGGGFTAGATLRLP